MEEWEKCRNSAVEDDSRCLFGSNLDEEDAEFGVHLDSDRKEEQQLQQQPRMQRLHAPRRRRRRRLRPTAIMHQGDEVMSQLGPKYSDERTNGSSREMCDGSIKAYPANHNARARKSSINQRIKVDPEEDISHHSDGVVSNCPTELQRGRTIRRPRNALTAQTPSSRRNNLVDLEMRARNYISDAIDFHSPTESQQMQHQNLVIGTNHNDYSPHTSHSPDEDSYQHYYKPFPLVTPISHHDVIYTPNSKEHNQKNASPKEQKDPFHHLEQELITMKMAHRSMSDLLASKSHSESQLLSRLSRLEEAHNQLQKEYNALNTSYSKLTERCKDMDRMMEDGGHEMQVFKTKEKAVSLELALMIRKDEENQRKLKELKRQLDKEMEERIVVEKELKGQKDECLKLQQENEGMSRVNGDLARQLSALGEDKQSLIHSVAALNDEMAQKDQQLEEAKTKETSLLEQLMVKISALETLEKKSSETKALFHREQEKNRALEHELLVAKGNVDRNEVLRGMLEEEQVRSRVLKSELLVLRKTAAADSSSISEQRNDEVNASSTGNNRSDPPNESTLSVDESMKLITPVICDATNIQREFAQRSERLLRKTCLTTSLMEQIPSLSADNYKFMSTLQTLEGIITSHIELIGVFDDAIKVEESCISKLTLLFDMSQDQLATLEKASSSSTSANNETTPFIPTADSNQRKQYTALATATRNHIKKIESLYQMALELLPIHSKHGDDHRHIGVANEMRLIFQQAMANLYQDTKQLGVMEDALVALADVGSGFKC